MIPRDQLTPGRAIFSARPPRQVHSSLAWRGPWYLRAWRASRCQCPRAGGEVDPGEGEDSGATGAVICPPSSCERYEIIWWYHGLLSCSKIVFFLDDDLILWKKIWTNGSNPSSSIDMVASNLRIRFKFLVFFGNIIQQWEWWSNGILMDLFISDWIAIQWWYQRNYWKYP